MKDSDAMLRTMLTGAAVAAALGTAQAGSILKPVEHAAEIPLRELELPTVQRGIVEFAVCNGCETHAVAMSGSTRYLVNDRPTTFEAFVAAARAARRSADVAHRSLVGLYFDATSKRLMRIALVAPLPPP